MLPVVATRSATVRRPGGTRDAIVDAATKLFLSNGYESTPVRAVAAGASVTTGAFYNYFPTKRDALKEVCRRYATAGAWAPSAGKTTRTASPTGAADRRGRRKLSQQQRVDALLLTLASFAAEDGECQDLLREILTTSASEAATAESAAEILLRTIS